ncbi:phage virion morphogenesis protein [Algiphilus sp.]|uniref:phage virion morphogenesis protein n=1 Tax=Algiphilus sp. TaxID=1872431 RepID=UPI0025C6C071|nr:phage virion morphogenesis protein [Algiphilus sp.]MCK5772001.1 phage virion morphogenesis protein [Algiphilus sp.]
MRVDLQLEDRRAQEFLARIQNDAGNPAPALKQISELVVDSTKQRFQTSRAPDGSQWEPNRPSTLFAHLGRFGGSYRRDGGLSARGSRRMAGKKPLIGESRALSTTINYRVAGNVAEIGSPMEYAPVHQFGARKGEFGSTRRGAPIPWGDIPARPFLGISESDSAMIRDVLLDFLGS